MKNPNLFQLFINELQDMYSAEEQIVAALPLLIKSSSHPELKQAFTDHLKETKTQVKRLEKVFSILDLPYKKKLCKGIQGILKEGEELISHTTAFT